jgi:hypothetical protein
MTLTGKKGAGMNKQLPAGRLGFQLLRRFARPTQRASLRYAPRRVLRDTASITAPQQHSDELPFLSGNARHSKRSFRFFTFTSALFRFTNLSNRTTPLLF